MSVTPDQTPDEGRRRAKPHRVEFRLPGSTLLEFWTNNTYANNTFKYNIHCVFYIRVSRSPNSTDSHCVRATWAETTFGHDRSAHRESAG